MENELNYLSEKIAGLDSKIANLHDGAMEVYDSELKECEKEHEMLENILNKLTEIALT